MTSVDCAWIDVASMWVGFSAGSILATILVASVYERREK